MVTIFSNSNHLSIDSDSNNNEYLTKKAEITVIVAHYCDSDNSGSDCSSKYH